MWKSEPYDLVLMDLQMPRMSGFEAARMIRSIELDNGSRTPTPIIAVTASTLSDVHARGAGIDEYLSKPIDTGRLAAAISRHVAGFAGAVASAVPRGDHGSRND